MLPMKQIPQKVNMKNNAFKQSRMLLQEIITCQPSRRPSPLMSFFFFFAIFRKKSVAIFIMLKRQYTIQRFHGVEDPQVNLSQHPSLVSK